MKFILTLTLLFFTSLLFSQETNNTKPFFISSSQDVKIIAPLAGRDLIPADLTPKEHKNNRWLNYPTNFKALPLGNDPLLNQNKNLQRSIPGNPPIVNFDGAINGVHTGAAPPDPTGAVGPNHYIHAYNSGFAIFDKLGNILVAHNSLANIFPNETLGDPIVLYDRYADRFLITEFSNSPDAFLMAVSLGPDPVNDGWATYRFDLDAFPDYPKFSIWHDGYYITANKGNGNVVYVTERDAMIANDATANIVGFTLLGVVQNPNTIFSTLAMNSVGPNLPNANTPGYITYLQDDAWAPGQDHLKIWEVKLNWANTASSTISMPIQINTSPFDTFTAAFGNGEVPQPNTAAKIDGITGLLSYMCNYYAFGNHNSITLNFNVDVNGDNTKLGIRWYELRDTNGVWSIEQEGTFAPNDDIYRFMGSMAMDELGNIGLAYSRGNANNFTSLYYTGRYANDPVGEMTINEELIVQGLGSQGFNRYGDYAQLTLDPTDNKTFWYTSEYFTASGAWRSRIASFKIAPTNTNDVGIIAITNPTDATLTNSETVTVTIFNFGESTQTNIPISYSVDGVVIANEVYTGTIASSNSATYTFTINTDLSTLGQTYTISATTSLTGDENNTNNTFTKEVTNLNANDLGVSEITVPNSGIGLANETISVVIRNFGGVAKSNFDVSYTINNNTPVTETVTTTLAPSSSMNYSFNTQGDFSALGSYTITATTLLNSDTDNTNDATTINIQNASCIPEATTGCGIDGIKRFVLGTINVDDGGSGCNTEGGSNKIGYSDRTNLVTDLDRNTTTHTVSVQQNWSGGTNGPEKFAMWIDFNDNGLFETTEQVILGTVFTVGNNLEDFTFNLSGTSNLGTHILRARAVDTSANPGDINDPCADYAYGETQDYMVKIVDSSILDVNELAFTNAEMVIVNLDNNQFRVELPSTKITETMVITLHNMLGQKVVKNRVENNNDKYTYTLDLNGLNSGVYLVRLGTSDFGKVKRIIVK